jgi:hypothetical protein
MIQNEGNDNTTIEVWERFDAIQGRAEYVTSPRVVHEKRGRG